MMSMLDPLPDNPYKTLGVAKDATVNDVKKAYRKLVLTCHPDKTGSLPASMKKEKDEQFHRVQQAHDLLTNDQERQRYDDRVQLEELRSELRRDLGKDGHHPSFFKSATFSHSPRSAPKTPSKSPTNPIFEASRGPPIYEERVPKGVYDEDVYGPRRGSSRKHDERFDIPSTPRRSMSGRGPERMPEDLKKPERKENDEDYYARKSREKHDKAERRSAYAEKKKVQSKIRRNDTGAKRGAFVESDSEDSDSVERFMSSPRVTEFSRRPEDSAKSKAQSTSRRNQSVSLSDSESDARERMARDHMRKTGSRIVDSLEKKTSSKKKTVQAVPPPPPPPPAPAVDVRRSSARRTNSTTKSKRNIDIVEPSREYKDERTFELPRRAKKEEPTIIPASPRMVTPNSARAKTFEPERSSDRPSAPRRTQTMPVNGRPARSSKLKHSKLQEDDDEDSGLSTDKSAKFTTRKYRVNPASDSDSDAKPRIISVEMESPQPSPTIEQTTRSRARREESPRTRSHRSEVRSPPRRSNTMDNIASHTGSSSKPRHGHSSSGDRLLYMEIPSEVSFSPRIGRDDIRFSEFRRGSADAGLSSRDRDRDRSSKDHRRSKDDYYQSRRGDHHPGLSRGEGSYTSVKV